MSEWDEAEKDVKAAEAAKAKSGNKPTNGRTNGRSSLEQQDILSQLFSPVFLEAFVLTFCAEWGDRSQIATIGKPADPTRKELIAATTAPKTSSAIFVMADLFQNSQQPEPACCGSHGCWQQQSFVKSGNCKTVLVFSCQPHCTCFLDPHCTPFLLLCWAFAVWR